MRFPCVIRRGPVRILMFTDRFLPELRSAAQIYHSLARAFQRRGHDVAVVTKVPTHYVMGEEAGAVRPGWDEVEGVRTLRVGGLPFEGGHPVLRGLDHLMAGWSFRKASREWPGADVVLVYSPPLPLASAGVRYQEQFGALMVLNVQDLYPQTAVDLGLLRNRTAIHLAERMERRAYRRAARIVVHSEGNRAYLLERRDIPPEKVRVIYNWVDVEAIRPGPRENGFRAEHGLGGKFVVSYAGLMGYAQDLAAVIECAASMQAEEDVLFLLVGEGVLEGRWKKMAAERGLRNVRFLPMQPRERYVQLLAASDVCLIPLSGDLKIPVVPGKLQSIMANGRPILAIADPGGDTPKLVEESGGGVNVLPGCPRALGDSIRRLKADPALREEMGRRGRAYAEAHFSLTHCAAAYEEVFLEALHMRAEPRSRS